MAANLTQASSGTFSIHGKGLKLTTREDAEPYVKALQEMGEEVNRIHLGGNTLGIEACQALASVIATKSNLQVSLCIGGCEWHAPGNYKITQHGQCLYIVQCVVTDRRLCRHLHWTTYL